MDIKINKLYEKYLYVKFIIRVIHITNNRNIFVLRLSLPVSQPLRYLLTLRISITSMRVCNCEY